MDGLAQRTEADQVARFQICSILHGVSRKMSRRRKYTVGLVLILILGGGALSWWLRQPPSIVAKITRLGGEVHSRYLPTTFALAEPLGLRRLESPYDVAIDSDQFTDRDLLRLVAFDTVTQLEIRSASITDASVAVLADSREIKQDPSAPLPHAILGFHLDCPQVTDSGLALCAKIVTCKVTIVAGPKVTGAFMQDWQDSRTLQFFALHGKTIGDDIVDNICRLPKTEEVDLQGTSVSDASIQNFAEMPYLVRLDVRNTRVTREGVDKLKQSLRHRVIILSDWSESVKSGE